MLGRGRNDILSTVRAAPRPFGVAHTGAGWCNEGVAPALAMEIPDDRQGNIVPGLIALTRP